MPVFRGPVTRSSTAHTPTRKCQIAKLSARCSNSIWSVLTVCSYCLMRCPSDEFIKCAIIEPLMLKLATWMGVRFDSQIDWLPEWFALWFFFFIFVLTDWQPDTDGPKAVVVYGYAFGPVKLIQWAAMKVGKRELSQLLWWPPLPASYSFYFKSRLSVLGLMCAHFN